MNRNSLHLHVMTLRRAALYGTGGAVLVAYLASANMPSQDGSAPAVRPVRAARAAAPDAIAAEVRSQAARLHARMIDAPVPAGSPRNPFAFVDAPRTPRASAMVQAAVAPDPPPVVAPAPPSLLLMGIAEETTAAGPRRTAVIALQQSRPSFDGDPLSIVVEGETVAGRYKVTKIGADAVELEDLTTKARRRIGLQ